MATLALVTSAAIALAAASAEAQQTSPAAGKSALWVLDTTVIPVENGCADALPQLEAVLGKSPQDHEAWLQLARCHGEAKAPEKRLAAYRAAWKLRPGDAQDAYLVAWSLEDMKRWQEAFDGYNAALALDSAHAKSIRGKGVTLYHLKRYAEALQQLNEALRRMPDDSFVLLHRALVLEKLDRLEEAMADLYRVIQTKPDQASRAYFAMMGIFEWRKMSAETLAATQIFLRYEPGNQSVLRDLPRKERNAQLQAAQGRVPTHMPLPPEQVARAAAQPAVVPVVAAPAPSAAKVPAGDTLQQKQAACQRGDLAACVRTGNAYEDGAGVQANPATAATWYRRACDGKDGDGCGRLGWLIFTGKGAPRNFEEGYALIEKGCDDLKSGEACYIASVVNYASDAEELRALGARKLMESCGNGYVEGCYEMSLNWLEGKNGFERDVVAGVVIMEEEACKKGHARACAVAGYEWEWNKELANDATRAVQLYRQACDAAAQLGCVYLGVAYGNGAGGLARDPARAAQLYTRACDGDVGGACSLLADAYRQGSGVARDASKADALARKGCELKSPYCGQTAAAAPAAAVAGRATPAPSPSPPAARAQESTTLAVGPDAGGYSCPDGRQIWVSRCYDQSAQASCQVVHLHIKNNGLNPETAATRAALLVGLRDCALAPLEFGAQGSISLVK